MKDGRHFGRPPDPYQPPATPDGRINVTDPDSRGVKGLRGFLQGYNAQAVTNEHQVVLAAEIETVGADLRTSRADARRHPTRARGRPHRQAARGATRRRRLLDGEQIQRIIDRGIKVLIPPVTGRRPTTRRNWDGGRYDEIRELPASDRGSELLPQAPTDDRARVRADEVQPRPRPGQTTRTRRRPRGMATDHHHPQPPQTSPPRARGRLTAAGQQSARRSNLTAGRPTSSTAGLSRQPRVIATLWAAWCCCGGNQSAGPRGALLRSPSDLSSRHATS